MQRLPGVTRPSNRLRNVFIGLCAVIALVAGLWWAAQRFLGINNYRALVVQRVEAATGMPCTVDAMALHFFPQPQVVVSGIHAGKDGVKLDIATVTALVDRGALLQARIEVPSMTIEGLEATLPDEFSPAENPETKDAPAPHEIGNPQEAEAVHVGAINIPQWTVKRFGAVYAQGDATISDPLGAKAGFTANATVPGLSPKAAIAAQGNINRENGAFALDGKATLTEADLAQAAGRSDLASAVLNAELSFSGSSPDDIAFALDGKIAASGAADVAGKVTGKAWWKAGEFTANDFTWESPGLHVLADVSRKADGELAAKVREAEASKDGLGLLLGMASPKGMKIAARKDAKVSIKDLLIGRAGDGALRWAKGDIAIQGIDVSGAQGTLAEDLKAKCKLEEGTLHILEGSASGLNVAGDLTPGAKGAVTFNLAAAAQLSNPMIVAALPPSIASAPKGKLNVKRASGTWRGGGGLPDDLAIEGTLEDGELNLKTDRFDDKITGMVASFATDGKTITAKVSANSGSMGALKFDGTCNAATKATDGTVSFSLNRLAAAFVPSQGGAEVLQAMLAAYDGASYAVSFRAPGKEAGQFTLENKATPPAKVTAALVEDKKLGVTTGAITADFEVPFAPAAKAMPLPASGEGTATVHFERTAAGRFSGTADLTAASLRVDPYLNKRAGSAVRLDIDGAAGDTWALEHLTLDVLGQPIALTPKGEGLVAENLQVELAKLAPLFPEGSEASGSVSGSIGTSPVAANLRLAGVHVKTPGGISIDEINGGLNYSPGAVRCDALHVMAYGSDFTIDGAMKDNAWSGTLRGARADLNTLAALRLATSGGDSGGGAGGAPAGGGGGGTALHGSVDASIEEIVFRKATVNNFKANIRFSPEEFAVENIACSLYGGSATGAFSLRTPGGKPEGTVVARIDFKDVDLKLLDDLSTEEPRGMYGPATGTIDLSFPSGGDAKPYLGVDGEVTFSARDGSLGKAGASGKVLAALRTTEIAQLQIPSLRDKGLSFATANAHIVCKQGTMTIDNFELAERTHTMTATGVIDFPADTMDVTLKIQLLQTVRDIVGAIPLLDRLAESGGIFIYFKGSPFDPKVSAAKLRPLQELRQNGGGLINGVKNLLGR